MVCKSCIHDPDTGLGNDLELSSVEVDNSVPAGERWHMYIDVYNNSWVNGDKGKICIYEGEQVIAKTETFYLGPDKTIRKILTGVMPDHSLYLNVSLVKEWGSLTRCEDGYAAYIPIGEYDPIDPGDIPPQDVDDADLGTWIMDNLVLVLVLFLIIIIILKFG